MRRAALGIILLLTFFGIADTAYLSQSEHNGVPLICNVQSLSECNSVVTSPYSRLFGLPLADFGLMYYIVLFVLIVVELWLPNSVLRRLIQLAALVGFVTSAYSVYTQLAVLHAICIYCMASAGTTFIIFPFALLLEPLRRKPAFVELTI